MKKICVYCGSRTPNDTELSSLAVEAGKQIARNGWSIVYGGGKVGMMGLVANAALEGNGEVIGIIPTALKKAEVVHTGVTTLHETQDMHTRKAMMESISDAFVVLPGGYGTLDEFFEILTWRQLGIHNKPIILINKNGYFDGLQVFVDKALDENFITDKSVSLFHIVPELEDCFEILNSEL